MLKYSSLSHPSKISNSWCLSISHTKWSPITTGDIMELILIAQPNDTKITWQIKNINISQNTVVTGNITTNLPSNTIFLAWQAGLYCGVDNLPDRAQFSTIRYYMESNY